MFEQASRIKLRFSTPRGSIAIDDLWDLPLTSTTGAPNLDDIARNLNQRLKSEAEESFVNKPAKSNAILKLALKIVVHIIDTILAERDKAKLALELKAKKQQIIDLIATKETDALGETSIEDLRKMLADLAA